MKRTVLIIQATAGLMFLGSCAGNDQSPGVEYMPDMYRSPAIEAYVDYDNMMVMSARKPAEGSIPFGFDPYGFINNTPYQYPNTPEGFAEASAKLENPLPLTQQMIDDGQDLYGKFCVHCHGAEGNGDGKMVQNDKFPPPPAYSSIQSLTAGRIFHVITYGKGLMGPHNSQLNKVERWKLTYYIQKLAGGAGAGVEAEANAAMPADSIHQAVTQ